MAKRKRNLTCNKPVPSNRPGKKFMVRACTNGREKLVHFGAKGYGHNYSARAQQAFRARHGCDPVGLLDKLTPRYWACEYLWAGPGGKTLKPPHRRCRRR